LFPKVTLNGTLGYFAPTFNEFGTSDSRFFLVRPEHFLGGFRSGPGARRIGKRKAQTDAALAAYQGAVLSALEDTEGALISYGRAQARRDALQGAAAASDKAADLAQALSRRLDRLPRSAGRGAHRIERGAAAVAEPHRCRHLAHRRVQGVGRRLESTLGRRVGEHPDQGVSLPDGPLVRQDQEQAPTCPESDAIAQGNHADHGKACAK
jgi:hypothetical protein